MSEVRPCNLSKRGCVCAGSRPLLCTDVHWLFASQQSSSVCHPLSSFALVVPVSHPHIKYPFFSSSGFYGGTHTVVPNIAKKKKS